jgi:hypothetical protein
MGNCGCMTTAFDSRARQQPPTKEAQVEIDRRSMLRQEAIELTYGLHGKPIDERRSNQLYFQLADLAPASSDNPDWLALGIVAEITRSPQLYYVKGIQQSCLECRYRLSVMLEQQYPDLASATRHIAAIRGHPVARYRCVVRENTDFSIQLPFLESAVCHGYLPALHALGNAYIHGERGVRHPDPSRAQALFQMSSNGGYAPATFNLALMHVRGEGVNPGPHLLKALESTRELAVQDRQTDWPTRTGGTTADQLLTTLTKIYQQDENIEIRT